MEGGSSEKSAAASAQKKQLNDQILSHELNPPLQYFSSQDLPVTKELNFRNTETSEFQPSNLELLTALQNKETRQLGASLLRAPISTQGGLLPQFNGAYAAIRAAYLYGSTSQSHVQPYTLPLSNLPSSRLQGEHMGSSKTLVSGRSALDPTTNVSMQNTFASTQAQKNALVLETSLPLRSSGNQVINPDPVNTPSGLDLGSGSSSSAKDPTRLGLKRKMPWQDERSASHRSGSSFGGGYQRYISSYGGRYTLYDKRYEEIGLPVDPHLRIFNATNTNGIIGESSTQKS